MNRHTAQKAADICSGSGFYVNSDTTADDVRKYFTRDNFVAMFGRDVIESLGETEESIREEGEYLISAYDLK